MVTRIACYYDVDIDDVLGEAGIVPRGSKRFSNSAAAIESQFLENELLRLGAFLRLSWPKGFFGLPLAFHSSD